MEKQVEIKLKKSTRKKAKWMVIFLNSLLTIIGTFTGSVPLLLLSALLFWVYVLLDKFNPLTKNTDVNKIIKKDVKFKNKKLVEPEVNNFYDNSHESGY
jgi:hypothetical protein